MEDWLDQLTRGNVLEVKTVLASVCIALAAYQLVLAAVGYGRLRPKVLGDGPALRTHRASGDVIAVLLVIVGVMCLAAAHEGEYRDAGGNPAFHAVTGGLLLGVLTLKVIVIRWWHAAGRVLPLLGATVFVLLGLTWFGSAGTFLS
jgi:Family of unknown function (DUF6529)